MDKGPETEHGLRITKMARLFSHADQLNVSTCLTLRLGSCFALAPGESAQRPSHRLSVCLSKRLRPASTQERQLGHQDNQPYRTNPHATPLGLLRT